MHEVSERWSPDGSKIVYAAYSVGGNSSNSEIYIMNSDGTNPTQLTDNSTEDNYPAISRDGTKISFMSRRNAGIISGDSRDFWVMNIDGSNPTLYSLSTVGGTADWSPDGTRIAIPLWDYAFDMWSWTATGQIIEISLVGPDMIPIHDGRQMALRSHLTLAGGKV